MISLAGGLGFKSNHHHHLLCVCCVCVENAAGVAGLKGRVKAAKDKTKDLLKAVNGTMATLNAIPNGMIASLCVCVWGGGCACTQVWAKDKDRVDQYQCVDRGQLLG